MIFDYVLIIKFYVISIYLFFYNFIPVCDTHDCVCDNLNFMFVEADCVCFIYLSIIVKYVIYLYLHLIT